MFEYIIDRIAPHSCLGCRQEGTLLCYSCLDTLPPSPSNCYVCRRTACRAVHSSLGSVFAATEYRGLAKELIRVLKFERGKAGAGVAAHLIARRMPVIADDSIVSFVPTASRRVRTRGYDQAALIARQVALLRQLPYSSVLTRRGQQRQVGQDRTVRKRQLQGVFQPAAPNGIRGKHVLLVDDVLTTGATLEAAAMTLYDAGVRRVDAVVFAAA